MNFFVVNLNEATSDEMCFGSIVFSDGYYLTKGPGDNAACLLVLSSTHHGVSLTTSSLPICENSAIVSI
jgi:hypothetical protein